LYLLNFGKELPFYKAFICMPRLKYSGTGSELSIQGAV
jgi:hypothetical protein